MADEIKPCTERVGKGVITWACYLPNGHKGPHAALENAPSMIERQRWEDGEQARAVLAESQGEPMPSSIGLHETPPPPHPELRQPRLDPEGQPKPEETAIPAADVLMEINNICPTCGAETSEVNNVQVRTGTGEIISCRQCWSCNSFFAPASTVQVIEPTKQRPGDQPLPLKNDQPNIQALVIKDIEDRIQVGIERYGTALQPFNGRDAALDAYEEALDLSVYLRQVRYEHSIIAGKLREMAGYFEDHHPAEARGLREMADVLEPPRGE